jgi:uncharacterized XkdX family phage protein
MTDFQRIKLYYDKGWATKPQVAQYVQFGKITQQQYQDITGDEYAA